MTIPVFILYLLFLFFGLIYIFLIISYTIGWYRMKKYVPGKDVKPTTRTTIIIPARNEENNIIRLLSDISKQTVPATLFEVLVVDDNSTDQTAALVEKFIRDQKTTHIKLLIQSGSDLHSPFKKKAIERAISESTGDLIITTDADCRVGNRWLETILSFYEENRPAMMVGPVCFHNEKSWFEKMQTPEFLSLIAITAGAIQINKPIMCNGANLAYEREAFNKAGGYGADRFSSGDDVFLMLRMRKILGGKSIRFIKNYNALVFTEAKKNLLDFYHQRTRWASKNKGYDFNILFVSASVYMVNLVLLAGFITGLFYTPLLYSMIWITLIKALIDLPVTMGIITFVKRKWVLLYALPLIILYPFYIVITGAMGIAGSYQWKDRKVKN